MFFFTMENACAPYEGKGACMPERLPGADAERDACKREILKALQRMSGKHHPRDVFHDWVECMAISISNSCHLLHGAVWREREEAYIATMGKYDAGERQAIVEMCAWLVKALGACEGDVLGQVYMECEMGSKGAGQFFTPYSVSLVSAEMALGEVGDGMVSINEPACGSGGMVIAAADVLRRRGINYQRRLDVVCQDLDWTAVCMCYVQLSLLGIRAVCSRGDTLTLDGFKERDTLVTPAKMGLLL